MTSEILRIDDSTPRARRARGLPRHGNQVFWIVVCVGPAVLGFLLWRIIPIGASLLIALTDWNVAGTPHWVGLENFRRLLFEDRLFWRSAFVTAAYTLVS